MFKIYAYDKQKEYKDSISAFLCFCNLVIEQSRRKLPDHEDLIFSQYTLFTDGK